jgi:hypothetical protein
LQKCTASLQASAATLNTSIHSLTREVKDMITGENVSFVKAARPLSLNAFQSMAKQYLYVLEKKRVALFDMYSLFEEGKELWPDQCTRAVTLLSAIGEAIQNFYTLLEEPLLLPEVVIPHRYLLLVALQHVDEQINALIPLLNRLRAQCRRVSKQTAALQQEIQCRFELLVKGYNETIANIRVLPDQARFQERILKAI